MTDTPAAYLRTSLEDFNRAHGLADQSQSISNQRKVILEYVQHNPEFSEVQIREFIDDGLTGTNTDRPQFQAMIEAARRGEVKCIIVKDLSRFGRNYLDVGDYLEHIFPFLGVRVIAVNDGYDSKQYEGKTGGMDIAFRNFMYENYSRDLSIKVRSAMHSRMKKVSQKIRSAEEKKRLKGIAAAVLPKNFGVIIRTAAVEAKDSDIEQDIRSLLDKWQKTLQNIRKNPAPAQLMSEMNRANTIIRDSLGGAFSQIVVDDEAMYHEIQNYIRQIEPQSEKLVKLYKGNVPIFDNFDISKQIKSLFAKYVSLRRGAYLIIEHTEAMNVIDVNSGNRTKAEDDQEQTAFDVNLAAAREIARQLRLRDLGGIVIIDFIDMHKAANRQLLYEEMNKLMATDKAKHTVLPLTKFGLMQITRQRVRPVAVQDVTDVCPTCNGTGRIEPTVLLDKKIENKISYLAQDAGHKYIKLRVSPYVSTYLNHGLWSLRRRWMWKYKIQLKIVADQSVGIVDVHYYDKEGKDLYKD